MYAINFSCLIVAKNDVIIYFKNLIRPWNIEKMHVKIWRTLKVDVILELLNRLNNFSSYSPIQFTKDRNIFRSDIFKRFYVKQVEEFWCTTYSISIASISGDSANVNNALLFFLYLLIAQMFRVGFINTWLNCTLQIYIKITIC